MKQPAPEERKKKLQSSQLISMLMLLLMAILFSLALLFHTIGKLRDALSAVQPDAVSSDLATTVAMIICAISFILMVPLLRRLVHSLDEHVKAEQRTKQENQELSNAVVNLLQGVDKLSQRDLTVRMDITEDATAPIADSLNLLADEIAGILQGVTRISHDISHFCQSVKDHSDTVIRYANQERDEVDLANAELTEASEVMVKIAELAKTCGSAADEAIDTAAKAKETVVSTVGGINSIREIIRETEKRIKRLGERSQEISSVVSLINSIAERTHILALNASIHAASAGEAGRGFVVIADEVQRLAENAREATGQISSLVNNIQTETSETVTIMNNVITEVVSGTKLAEQAGVQMEETLLRTHQLVNMVRQIAVNSDQQVKTATLITERARAIKGSTQKTNAELQEQSVYTDKLVQYSSELVKAVGVFKLPDTPLRENVSPDERNVM